MDWERETGAIAPEEPVGYSPVVYDGQLWLVGANRSGRFTSEMLVSADGKSSRVERGETVFTYSNDVWQMRATRAQPGR